jgi:hypothetical protein
MAYIFQIKVKTGIAVNPMVLVQDSSILVNQINFQEQPLLIFYKEATYANFFCVHEIEADFFKVISFLPSSTQAMALLMESIVNALQKLNLNARYEISTTAFISANDEQLPTVTKTENQLKIERLGMTNIPDVFKCKLTQQLMQYPVKIPRTENFYIEYTSYAATLYQSEINPFTQQPVAAADFMIDQKLKRDIQLFMTIEVHSLEWIKQVNDCLDVQMQAPATFYEKEGNPYGEVSQRYRIGQNNKFIFWKVLPNSNGVEVEAAQNLHEVTVLNYPEKAETRRAFRNIAHALLSENRDEFTRILNSYPLAARRHMLVFASEVSMKNVDMPVSYSDQEALPHRKRLI